MSTAGAWMHKSSEERWKGLKEVYGLYDNSGVSQLKCLNKAKRRKVRCLKKV